MLHDVEAVVDDLVCRIGDVLNCSLEVRFPQVHGHGLDALELLRRELLAIILEAFGLAILSHKFHRSAEQVADHGHVVMTFAKGPFIDAKIPRWGGFLPSLSSPDGSLHDLPSLIPADPHEPAGAGYGGALA